MKRLNLFIILAVLLCSCAEGDNLEYDTNIDGLYSKQDAFLRNSNDTISIDFYDSIYKSLEIKIDSIVRYMNQSSATQTQGASCYNNYLFDFGNNMTYIHIYDMNTKSLVKRFNSQMSNALYHCNNVCFSNIYYSENDIFPLLFVSQQRTIPQEVQVCRITGELDNPEISIICVIMLPTIDDLCVKNRTDVVLDNENNAMYAYTESKDYNLCTLKFNIPQVLNNQTIYLSNQDIKEISIYNNIYVAKQGAVIKNGFLYVIKGIPNRNPLALTIINLYNHSWTEFDLSDYGVSWEPEGIFFYNEELYCTSNNNRGIYKFYFDSIVNTK